LHSVMRVISSIFLAVALIGQVSSFSLLVPSQLVLFPSGASSSRVSSIKSFAPRSSYPILRPHISSSSTSLFLAPSSSTSNHLDTESYGAGERVGFALSSSLFSVVAAKKLLSNVPSFPSSKPALATFLSLAGRDTMAASLLLASSVCFYLATMTPKFSKRTAKLLASAIQMYSMSLFFTLPKQQGVSSALFAASALGFASLVSSIAGSRLKPDRSSSASEPKKTEWEKTSNQDILIGLVTATFIYPGVVLPHLWYLRKFLYWALNKVSLRSPSFFSFDLIQYLSSLYPSYSKVWESAAGPQLAASKGVAYRLSAELRNILTIGGVSCLAGASSDAVVTNSEEECNDASSRDRTFAAVQLALAWFCWTTFRAMLHGKCPVHLPTATTLQLAGLLSVAVLSGSKAFVSLFGGRK
jgi:hypothetical protein